MEQSECFVPKLHINHRLSRRLPEPLGLAEMLPASLGG